MTRPKSTIADTGTTVDGMTKLLSPAETRRALGVSDRRLRQPDLDRRLDPVRVGSTRAYRVDAVAAELNRRVDGVLARRGGK